MKHLAIYTRYSFLSGLSFVIPYDKETAAFKSREETAKTWAGDKGTKHIIDNDFVA